MLKRYTFIYLLILSVFGLFWGGCNVINPKEQVPTYIHIDSFRFQGTASSDIKAVWAYYNNNPVGVFDLPATFPVPATGTGVLSLAPAVLINGQNNLLTIYPYYSFDTMTFTAKPGTIINHAPKTDYYSGVISDMLSDFSNSQTKFKLYTGNVEMVPVTADSLVYKDASCGGVFLRAKGDSCLDSTARFSIPAGTQYAFIEFDYNSTVPFFVGMSSNLSKVVSSDPYFLAGIRPNGKWQKFYLNIHGFTSTYTGDTYSFFVKAILDPSQTSGRLLLDNVKLVTF